MVQPATAAHALGDNMVRMNVIAVQRTAAFAFWRAAKFGEQGLVDDDHLLRMKSGYNSDTNFPYWLLAGSGSTPAFHGNSLNCFWNI